MKEYSVRVSISAECESDLIERIEDLTDNPINSFIEQSIELNEDSVDIKEDIEDEIEKVKIEEIDLTQKRIRLENKRDGVEEDE